MGLGTIELILSVEDAFGVEISDAQAEKIATCGALCHWLAREKNLAIVWDTPPTAASCASSQSFYRVRRALLSVAPELGLTRRAIAPTTRWKTILPLQNRPQLWAELQNALGADVPDSRTKRWPFPASQGRVLWTQMPFATVGALAAHLGWHESLRAMNARGTLEWPVLRALIAQIAEVKAAQVFPHSRFNQDLHLN